MHTKSDWNGFLFLTSPSKSKDDLSAAWKSHDGLSPTIQTWNSKVVFWGESSLTDCWSWPLTLWWEVFLDEGNWWTRKTEALCLCFVPVACVHLFVCLFVHMFTLQWKSILCCRCVLGVNFSSVALVNIYAALVYARAHLVDLIASLATNNRVLGCRYNSISFWFCVCLSMMSS